MTDEELLARATEFELMPFDPQDRRALPRVRSVRIARRSNNSWAILCDANFCLNHEGAWEYESMPSSRTDDFLQRCRWPVLRDAVAFAEDHLAKYPSGYKPDPLSHEGLKECGLTEQALDRLAKDDPLFLF